MLKNYCFEWKEKGIDVLVLGAIHGDEICGSQASQQIIKKIQNWQLEVQKGSVTFIPIVNQKAYNQWVRYIDQNLNRVIKKHKNPNTYEQKLADELTDYIENADCVLDIHSMPSNGTEFVFQDFEDTQTSKFIKSLGIKNIVKGWPDLYEDNNDTDTITYAYKNDKIGALVECGKNGSQKSIQKAYSTIINAMKYFDILKGQPDVIDKLKVSKVYKRVFKEKKWQLTKNYSHMDIVKKWEKIAQYEDGEKMIADESFCMMLPMYNNDIGDEWFYKWTQITGNNEDK